jgi:tripeptide aminopeptidase
MRHLDLAFDTNHAVDRLVHFLSIEGVTGQEAAIGKAVVQALVDAGIPRKAIRFDRAKERIPLPTQTGNLIVTLPGTRPGPRRLLMTHLDTVPLCAGAQPLRKGNRIVAAGQTALGGDDRTGVACLVTVATMLRKHQLPHPPLTLLFTVREESGLWGARYVDPAELGNPREGFNVDGRSASEITIGAVGAERWHAEIFGKAAHAGVHPEQGISASVVASLALTQTYREGWFGKISKNGREGTANVGSFGGTDGKSAGVATNVVTDYAVIHGESRSHDPRFVRTITNAYRDAFRAAAKHVSDDRGRIAKVRFETRHDYYPFHLKATEPVVRHALAAAEQAELKPTLRVTNGGLDANWLVRHGIPTVTFGAGQNNIHTVDEFVDVAEFAKGCRMALAVATLDSAGD